MALFERNRRTADDEFVASSDVATRALSVTVVETDFVAGVYGKLASVYDYVFGPTLHAGRLQALKRMAISSGDRILEVGVGTGINLTLYPKDCQITGVDLSESMLEKAHERVAKHDLSHVRVLQMDATSLSFPDASFDIVYAPYLVSVVPDPAAVAREMARVCRPGGRIIILNHFRSSGSILAALERAISPFTVHIGFTADLDLPGFLAQGGLTPVTIEKVNIPPIWSLVTCIKD
jgi:phosphatidylethanolamine/phosphatidyl-N-methylethanolamine N-methyltransferase